MIESELLSIIESDDSENQKLLSFSYDFSIQESKDLVLLFRKYEKDLPDSLKDFSISLHQYIYNSMTIDEAEKFFHESI